MYRTSPIVLLLLFATTNQCFAVDVPSNVRGFLSANCYDCHQGDDAEAGLDLTQLSDELSPKTLDDWVRIHDRVVSGEMPPKDYGELSAKQIKQFQTDASSALLKFQTDQYRSLGRVRGRRLTNRQLERTLQDLLGIDIPLESLMPEEPRVHDFATVASGQSISHFQLKTHLTVVDAALDEAFRRATNEPDEWTRQYSAKEVARRNPRRRCREPELIGDTAVVWSGTVTYYGRLPVTTARTDGWYRIKVNASALNIPEDHGVWCTVRTGMCVSGAPLLASAGGFEAVEKPIEWTFEAWLPKGHMFEIRPGDSTLKLARFAGGQIGSGEGGPQNVPGLAIHEVQLQRIHKGPDNATIRNWLTGDLEVVTDKRGQFVELKSEDPRSDIARLVRSFADRAFRRPVQDDDLAPYLRIATDSFAKGESLQQSLRNAYRAILCSPRFMYFQEAPGQLDDYAIASRLSYMLWNSMPDAALMKAAAEGQLQNRDIVADHVGRMLKDSRGENFVKDLAHEWLDLSEIDFTEPDRRLYPGFDVIVQDSMLKETHLFLQNMLTKDLSVSNVIDSKSTFLNSRLARYYGLDRVHGDYMREVRLRPEDHRGGLMTQGAIMKVTANGTTTSPVLRGIWVSERLLGVDIPPPPASVPAIEPDIRGAKSIREMLALHKSDTGCASCHVKIDPPGFALENFDPSGRWRDRYTVVVKRKRTPGPEIDPHFEMPDGRAFADLSEFQALVLDDTEAIAANVVRKLLTYGTGATVNFADRDVVDSIVAQSEGSDYGFRTLLQNTIASETFRTK